jgi:hypothetical protein
MKYLWVLVFFALCLNSALAADFQAGAAVVDITPQKLPVLVNGGMLSRSIDKVSTPISARALAVSDGTTTIVIVVVDSCMIPRPVSDEAKSLASHRSGVPLDRLLISATHTHSAPASMACLGTEADTDYIPFLQEKLAEVVVTAVERLQPARIGFIKTDASDFMALRRWIRQPGKIVEDPFGNLTVRANMHAAANWDDVTGESGPEDPDLSLVSIQTRAGKPLALLANLSMHYFGDKDISADYFGRFCEGLKSRIAPDGDFVGLMSHGCSGDIWRRDYTLPADTWDANQKTIDQYTQRLLDLTMTAYGEIEYREEADVVMAERRMTLKYRVPDKQRLEWAQRLVEAMGDQPAKTQTEVYAREQILLHERQQTEIVVQGLRIGDIGIATTPNETYAITGLKIKAASPLPHNLVIELANGGDGYIPPPEQHLFGGYNTWAARSAGLEVTAEPKIAEACIELLEQISGKPRRQVTTSQGTAAQLIAAMKPAAWYRLDEFAGPRAIDSSGNQRDAFYEPAVTYYLEGPHSESFCAEGEKNRAAMFVGGRLQTRINDLKNDYAVSCWIWNGMPDEAREVSGWIFSRGRDHGLDAYGDHLGVAGTGEHAGRLIFFHGDNPLQITAGKTPLPRWQWQQVLFSREGEKVRVYLNGQLEIETSMTADFPDGYDRIFLGGRADNDSNWEGRIDEVALFNRALLSKEAVKLSRRATD